MATFPRATGSVALDIGEGFGALIVHTGPQRLGEEIEVARDTDGFRTHVAVLPREVHGRTANAAVFGSLPEGTYRLYDGDGQRAVTITSGAIQEIFGQG